MNEISVSSSLSGHKLASTVTVPKGLRKYFNSFRLFACYDAPLRADMSILNIPLVSTALPLAWLTGTDVHVETLDKKYVEAMNAVKNEFNLMYPRGKFTTNIIVDDLVENETQSEGTALLFSGGVDSTYSLIKNISLRPRLMMFWGVQHYHLVPSYEKYAQMVRKTYSDFAKREGLDINFVETNTMDILNDGRITHDFHKILRGTGFYSGLHIPLFLLGLPAPLSIGRFNRVIIASTLDSTHNYTRYPYGSRPGIDEKFAWADSKVIHDGVVHRFRKMLMIGDYLEKQNLQLKVCNHPPLNKLNCSACEKCYSTIAPLILQGIDPNRCGFEVNGSTLKSMRTMFENKEMNASDIGGDMKYWKVLQDMVPDELEHDLYGSKEFFEWFRNLDVDQLKKKRDYRGLLNMLPYSSASTLEAFYYSARNRVFRH